MREYTIGERVYIHGVGFGVIREGHDIIQHPFYMVRLEDIDECMLVNCKDFQPYLYYIDVAQLPRELADKVVKEYIKDRVE